MRGANVSVSDVVDALVGPAKPVVQNVHWQFTQLMGCA